MTVNVTVSQRDAEGKGKKWQDCGRHRQESEPITQHSPIQKTAEAEKAAREYRARGTRKSNNHTRNNQEQTGPPKATRLTGTELTVNVGRAGCYALLVHCRPPSTIFVTDSEYSNLVLFPLLVSRTVFSKPVLSCCMLPLIHLSKPILSCSPSSPSLEPTTTRADLQFAFEASRLSFVICFVLVTLFQISSHQLFLLQWVHLLSCLCFC
jgi:hypothetical protein